MAKKLAAAKKWFGRGATKVQATCASSQAPRWMIYAAFALLAVIVTVLAYQYMVRPAMNERFSSPPSRLVFLHMTGCGWCVRFMPTWDAFVRQYEPALKKVDVQVLKLEASDPAAAEYQVRSYPTVLLVKSDGTNVKFDGERTIEGLQKFLLSNGIILPFAAAEGFANRPESGGQKIMSDARSSVKNNTGDPNVTSNMGKGAGMKTKKEEHHDD
jgi:thiol-disulfide isomerase/thioredoxin